MPQACRPRPPGELRALGPREVACAQCHTTPVEPGARSPGPKRASPATTITTPPDRLRGVPPRRPRSSRPTHRRSMPTPAATECHDQSDGRAADTDPVVLPDLSCLDRSIITRPRSAPSATSWPLRRPTGPHLPGRADRETQSRERCARPRARPACAAARPRRRAIGFGSTPGTGGRVSRGAARQRARRRRGHSRPPGAFRLLTASSCAVPPGARFCFFFRPGPYRQGGPLVTTADLTMWGLGVPGLSVRVNGRAGVDLGESEVWPGTEPAVQLLEAYAEYAIRRFTARAGRQLLANRLGIVGLRRRPRCSVRAGPGLEAEVYVGLGLRAGDGAPRLQLSAQPAGRLSAQSRQLVAGGAHRLERPAAATSGSTTSARWTANLASSDPSEPPSPAKSATQRAGVLPRGPSTTWPTPGSETRTAAVRYNSPRDHRRCRGSAVPAPFRSLDHLGRLQPGALPRGERLGLAASRVARLELQGPVGAVRASRRLRPRPRW